MLQEEDIGDHIAEKDIVLRDAVNRVCACTCPALAETKSVTMA